MIIARKQKEEKIPIGIIKYVLYISYIPDAIFYLVNLYLKKIKFGGKIFFKHISIRKINIL